MWATIQLIKYPKIKIGLGREELTDLRSTTIQTLLAEVFPALGYIADRDYVYRSRPEEMIEMFNGSKFILKDLKQNPRDPEFQTLGSLNLTHVIIEEAGQVTRKAKDVFSSRSNRWLNKKYGIVGKTVMTCNPAENFLFEDFYTPYAKLGAGDSQEWVAGRVEINDVVMEAKRCFVHSLATDNSYLDKNYVFKLEQMNDVDRKRLLEGDWHYQDSDKKLFKAMTLAQAEVGKLPDRSEEAFIGVDVAREGKDYSVMALVRGNVLVDLVRMRIDDTVKIAKRVMEYAQENDVPDYNVAIDAVGVGAGVVDRCNEASFYVKEFKAGEASENDYDMVRSEVYDKLAEAMKQGDFHIYSGCPYLGDTVDETGKNRPGLRRQLMAHEYETTDKVKKIESKKKLKARLGISPDDADALSIAYFLCAGEFRGDPGIRWIG